MPLLNKRELASIAEYTPSNADANLADSTEAEREELKEHQAKFIQYFKSNQVLHTWCTTLEEISATAGSSMRDTMERWLKSENLLQRHILMTAHTRILFTLRWQRCCFAGSLSGT
jgi:hypothetical protein